MNEIKKNSKVPWNIIDITLVIILELTIFYILSPVIRLFAPENPDFQSLFVLTVYLIQTVVTISVIYFFTFRKYKISLKDLGFKTIKWLDSLKYVIGMWLLTTILLIGISEAIFKLFGSEVDGFRQQMDHIEIFGDNSFGYITLIFTAFVIAPVIEEAMFRGFILPGLMKHFTPLSSVLITSLLFSVLHFEFLSIIPLFIIGSILGWLYIKQKSIYGCLMFHAINNGIALLAEFFLKQ